MVRIEFSGYAFSMIDRSTLLHTIKDRLKKFPIVALLGARQVGKTTLARQIVSSRESNHYFDLENPIDLARLSDPVMALNDTRGIIVIDEIQRRPGLFETLRVLADRRPLKARFLVLGSASRDLIGQSSETLAGRISYLEITPFSYQELGSKQRSMHWVRGGYPRSLLASSEAQSLQWRRDFIATFLERDLPTLGIRMPSSALYRFWVMIAGLHGNLINYSELGRSFGVSDTNIRRYLDILSETFMLRQLQPWHANIQKRQVKSPKIYVRDSGLLHTLLSIPSKTALQRTHHNGASWEGYALEEALRALKVRNEECFFWRTHTGAELDLLLPFLQKPIGIECKLSSHPTLTPSMNFAIKDLALHHLYVVYPGSTNYMLSKSIEVVGLNHFLTEIAGSI
jgi:uncharacterized protein